ncbi:MAG: hypothetical protein JWM61_1156, partial [Micrococcaceae bacterium]|nr:hypothetical protein [Micrococcaceae bacterium]
AVRCVSITVDTPESLTLVHGRREFTGGTTK